jgi:hypothetical protein
VSTGTVTSPGLLDRIGGPADLRDLTTAELTALAAEVRERLVATVSRTGGHLGPGLGVVELTLALHRVFDSPADPVVWDTGHQAYVHKLVTGRQRLFDTLRQPGGSPATPRAPRARTTGWRTRTPPPRCPTPTGWPARCSCAGPRGGGWSPSSGTAR